MAQETTKRLIASLIFVILSVLFITLGIFEISFSDTFSWAEVLHKQFPKLYRYSMHIGVIECLVGGLLVIPAYFLHKSFAIKAIETCLRLGLGGMFIFASIFKIADPKEFATLVAQYQFLPHNLVNPFALFLPQIEFWAGVALIFTPFVRENASLILGMFIAFIIALIYALWHDLGIICGCFAIEGAQGKDETWTSLIRDLILLGPTAWLMWRPRRTLWNIWLQK
ncbi:MAG: hypothetical protein GX801_05685 [Fibrobacter sp.]|nr:hypothetical protein [Fibrobacter sp.]